MGSRKLVTVLPLLGSVVLLGSVLASPAFAQSAPKFGFGRTPSPAEVRAVDISISPTGDELPPGRGNAKQGAEVFEAAGCISCHGEKGLDGPAPALSRERARISSHLATGAHPAPACAVRDDRVGFHQSRHACRG